MFGLQDHPFLIEALPDLVSAAIHDSPKIELGEASLPECLKTLRDLTPIRSLDERFGHFYTLAASDDAVKCCSKLDRGKISPFARSVCDHYTSMESRNRATVETFVENNGLTRTPYDVAHLNASFEAENCRLRTENGLVFLDNCDTNQFAYPLVSFFFRLKELTGKSFVSEFFEQMRATRERTAVFECGFVGPDVSPQAGAVKARVALRPLLGSFMGLRESMNSAERASFDRAWAEHALGKMIDLDRMYRNETLAGFAQLAVKAINPIYRTRKGCNNVYKFDSDECRVACEKKR